MPHTKGDTMSTYTTLKTRQEKEFNDFPMFFAFSNKQLEEGMKKIGLELTDTDKIYSAGGGGYYKKTDAIKLKDLLCRHTNEKNEAIKADSTGEGFIFDMFDYELSNHEYCITMDPEPTMDALGISQDDINKSEALQAGLKLAKSNQWDEENC